MRITEKTLNNITEALSNLTGENFKVHYWDGMYHIMYKGTERLCEGTARECFNFIYAFRVGYKFSRKDK